MGSFSFNSIEMGSCSQWFVVISHEESMHKLVPLLSRIINSFIPYSTVSVSAEVKVANVVPEESLMSMGPEV